MLVEPSLERAAVAEALEREWGRTGSAVCFIPVGETSCCYAAIDDQGGRWFVKFAGRARSRRRGSSSPWR
jgi:hypothetical protein